MEYFLMLIKILIFLPFIIFAIILSLKYGGNKLQSIQNGRFMKILERVPLSKDNSLLVVKMGEKAFVVASSQGRVEIIREVENEELAVIEVKEKLPQFSSIKDMLKNLRKKEE